MDDKLDSFQSVLDGIKKRVDELHQNLSDQKEKDLVRQIEAIRMEFRGEIDKMSKEIKALQDQSSPAVPQAAVVVSLPSQSPNPSEAPLVSLK